MKKILFLDHDGVLCLPTEFGNRFRKRRRDKVVMVYSPFEDSELSLHVKYRFDNFNQKAIKVLNEIIQQTDAEIVVTSDWRLYANLEEMGEYYESQGIIKKPIGFTKLLQYCDQPDESFWLYKWDLEQSRVVEINQWLKDNPDVTHWVAVDDLNLGKHAGDWGLNNFVHTNRKFEGIKQCGVKDKIIKFLS
jgi:hypothetical protein